MGLSFWKDMVEKAESNALKDQPPLMVMVNGPLNAKAMAAIKELSNQVVHLQEPDVGPPLIKKPTPPWVKAVAAKEWSYQEMLDTAIELFKLAGVLIDITEVNAEYLHDTIVPSYGGQPQQIMTGKKVTAKATLHGVGENGSNALLSMHDKGYVAYPPSFKVGI